MYNNVRKANQKSCKQIIIFYRVSYSVIMQTYQVRILYTRKQAGTDGVVMGPVDMQLLKRRQEKLQGNKCGKQSPIQTGTKEQAIGSIKSNLTPLNSFLKWCYFSTFIQI